MKRISILIAGLLLCAGQAARSQDAAIEERLNRLSGQIEDLIASQKAQREQIASLAKEVASLRDEQNKPNANYAGQDELKRLSEALKEVDRKRVEDYEKIHADLLKLKQTLTAPAGSPGRKAPANPPPDHTSAEKTTGPDQGFEYVIQHGDSLSLIVQAYKEKNVKVTVDQILKANPGLVPEKLKVGQKIFIPAPQT